MEYISEHSFIGNLGHILVILAFVSSVLFSLSYFLSFKFHGFSEEKPWKDLGRFSLYIHTFSVIGFITCMFIMLANHYFEYEYVFKHSSRDMPKHYILVAFWGGQQGSLMLWAFWNTFLIFLLRFSAKSWEAPVLFFMGLLQIFVSAMLLGIDIGPYHLGTSPFTLVRETGADLAYLWSQIPEYLSFDPAFADGRGLTPSLQNYWMIIHPPTLFFGFALTTVPAAYAMSGLWKKEYQAWVKPALPWAFLAISILGTGILMGGAWAYESLNFGGFWAWDPVENASLIPWVFLVAGAHVMLITKNRGTSRFTSIFLTLTSFWFVIYSSFLTRSGVLGEDSVHSFTGDGMAEELLIMLAFFVWLGILGFLHSRKLLYSWNVLTLLLLASVVFFPVESVKIPVFSVAMLSVVIFAILAYIKGFPKDEKEEELFSREFWMFAGALVLVISAIQVIGATSLSAIGSVFDQEWKLYGDNTERNQFYNNWQVLFAIFYLFFMGWSQYIKYKNDTIRSIFVKTVPSLLLSFAFSVFVIWVMDFKSEEFSLSVLIFTSTYAIIGNFDYWLRFLKGKLNQLGSPIAHIGFAMVVLGAVLSNGKQRTVSVNTSSQRVDLMSKSFKESGDIQLFRGDTARMDPYFILYKDEFIKDEYLYYYRFEYFDQQPKEYLEGDTVRYNYMAFKASKSHQASDDFMKDMSPYWQPIVIEDNEVFLTLSKWQSSSPGKKLFEINPRVLLDIKNFKENFPEPGTKRFLNRDLFTHVRYADLSPQKVNEVKTGKRIDDFMVPYEIKNIKKGDTIPTPGHVFIVDTIFRVPDSLKEERNLLPNDDAVAITLIIYEISDRRYQRSVSKELLHITRSGELNVPDRRDFESLGLSMIVSAFYPEGNDSTDHAGHEHEEGHNHEEEDAHQEPKLDSLSLKTLKEKIDSLEVHLEHDSLNVIEGENVLKDPLEHASFDLQVADREYVVMKAIVFPWINILWIGMILMGLGTTMAVFYRIKQNKKTSI